MEGSEAQCTSPSVSGKSSVNDEANSLSNSFCGLRLSKSAKETVIYRSHCVGIIWEKNGSLLARDWKETRDGAEEHP